MTPDQAALLGKAESSLEAARFLGERGFYDFAASRAYYSMFYSAQAFLFQDSSAFSKHSAVIAAFGQRFVKTGLVPEHFHRFLIACQARFSRPLAPAAAFVRHWRTRHRCQTLECAGGGGALDCRAE